MYEILFALFSLLPFAAFAMARGRVVKPGADAPAKISVKLVEFVQPENTGENEAAAAIPDPWKGKGTEAVSTLTPAANWQNPGEYIDGEYLGFTADVGPNKSRLYHLRHRGANVSVWGSTILDQRIDSLNPARGAQIMVQYLGTVPTKRNMSPAKDFRVRVL